MANAKKKCGCSDGAYAVFKINTAAAAWGSIVGDINKQEDLMELFSKVFGVDNVLTGGNVEIEEDEDGNYIISTKTFEFEQGESSDCWVIEHDLNKYPTVITVDSAGTVFHAEVRYDSLNQVTVLLNGATKGKAYLN